MASTSPESGMSYLSLALIAQRVVDLLLKFVDEEQTPEGFEESIGQVLSSLRAVANESSTASMDHPSGALATYRHLRTLDQVWSAAQIAEIIFSLQELLNAAVPREKKKADAEELIDRFFELQSQALWNFSEPVEPIPQSIRGLCVTA